MLFDLCHAAMFEVHIAMSDKSVEISSLPCRDVNSLRRDVGYNYCVMVSFTLRCRISLQYDDLSHIATCVAYALT